MHAFMHVCVWSYAKSLQTACRNFTNLQLQYRDELVRFWGSKVKEHGRKATLEILNVIGSRGPCFSGQRYNLFHQRSSSSTVTVMFRLSQLTYFSCFPWYNRTRLWGMIFCVFTSTPVNICILLCCMTGMHIAVILTVACVTVGCAVRSISTTPPQVTW